MGTVATILLDLSAYWIQTLSDYDVLVAKTVLSKWAKKHMPGISRHSHNPAYYTTFISEGPPQPIPISCQDDHILFTEFSLSQPGGQSVKCHNRYKQSISPKQIATRVHIMCNACKSRCMVKKFKTDMATILRRHALVTVRYPQDQYLLM